MTCLLIGLFHSEDLKLHERNHLIITQAIRSQTMMNVVTKNQWQTMGSIGEGLVVVAGVTGT